MSLTGKIPAIANAMLLKQMSQKNLAGALISARLTARILLGEDDEGLLSLSEYAQFFRNLRLATDLPLIADGQSGFGNALNTFETAKELARSGADYLLLNDQGNPSHSDNLDGAISLAELLGKIKAAQDGLAGSNTELLIELQGIDQYGLDGLTERIKLLKDFGIQNWALNHLSLDQLEALQNDQKLAGFGYTLENETMTTDEINSYHPRFILDLKSSLRSDNQFDQNMTKSEQPQTQAISHSSADYDKFDRLRKQFKTAVMTKGNLLDMVVAPDSLSARIAEKLGFKAIFAAGYATSASNLAQPDRGLADFGIMLNKCREIINAVDLPVFADADTGYGDINNVIRTVKNYEAIGACGIFLEDQIWPKRCGHMAGKSVEPTEILTNKLKAAVRSRKHDDFLIMARTDARSIYGLDAAIERGHQYLAAGADMIFIEAPESTIELKKVKESFPDTPLMANMIEGGATPILSHDELQKLGYSIVVHPTALTYGQTYATQKILSTLKETGDTLGAKDHMLSFNQFNHFIGLDDVNARENKYTPTKMQQILDRLKPIETK